MKLSTKILSFGTLLGVLSTALILVISHRSFDRILIAQIAQSGVGEASTLATIASEDLLARREIALLPKLQRSQEHTRASSVVAIDASARAVAHTDVTGVGALYADPWVKTALRSDEIQVRHEGGSAPRLRIGAPVFKEEAADAAENFLVAGSAGATGREKIGLVLFEIPLSAALATSKKIVWRLTTIIAAIGLLTLTCAMVTVRGVMEPVHLLIDGFESIASGLYGTRVPVSRDDEIGKLADGFNRMSSVLSVTTVSREFMHSVVSGMNEPLFVLGSSGAIEMSNEAAHALLGYGSGELIGLNLQTILAEPPGGAKTSEKLSRASNVEVSLLRKDRQPVVVLYSSSALQTADGKESGMVVVARDMTERKKMEELIRQSEKLSAVGQLAAGVAHEINNPLGVILGYSQALARRVTPGDAMETPLRSIEKEALRCKNLVQDLLTFSRVAKVEREPTDLNASLQSALSLVKAQARMGQVTVVQELAEGLPRFLGNANQVQQVIINLATNAMDAMKNNGTLTFRTELVDEPPMSWVCLRVIDTGEGIPADQVSRIFDPFFTTKAVGKGTGLGLSLAHEIVQKHSGRIDVKSRPGRTEFAVRFPARAGRRSGTGGAA